MPSHVTGAMQSQRPAKDAVRELWADIVVRRQEERREKVPLYLTLAGAEGYDIELLIKKGVIEQTKTGAIVDAEDLTVVAVESKFR